MEKELNLNLNMSGEKSEGLLVIRHDEALKVYEKQKVALDGVITTPSEYITKRRHLVDQDKCYVEFNRDPSNLSIKLVVNEEDHFKTTVSGSMKINPFLQKLKINNPDSPFSIPELRKLLKFAKIHFQSGDRHRELMFALTNYKAKVDKTIEEFNSRDQGKKGGSVTMQLSEESKNFNFGFVLFTELFVGGTKVEIPITVGIEPGSGQVELYVEFLEWEKLVDEEIQSVFEEQVKFFESFVVVYKN